MAKKNNTTEMSGAQELYNFLFEACNILRGPVSQDNFKDYITPILYFKRISDVYDEETEAALEAGLLQEPAKERTPINQPFTHSPQQPVIQDQPQGKKTLLDRIKANPVVFAVVAAILAFIGYRVYKAKKG